MKRAGLFTFVATSLLVLTSCFRVDSKVLPQRLVVRVNGSGGSRHDFVLNGGGLNFKTPSTERKARAIPTEEQWRQFRRSLDELQVWKWTGDYFNPHVLEGEQWEFEIACDDVSIKASGSNRYPDDDGLGRPSEADSAKALEEYNAGRIGARELSGGRTAAFKRFVAAVERLIGEL